jgi:hypothetical protein
MGTRLINVRLDEERVRKARALRESGVALSDVVREAIDVKFDEVNAPRRPGDVEATVKAIFDQYPDPPSAAQRPYDVHDRREARAAILRKLRRKSR